MNEVKWIKLEVGMFDGMSFKKIKRAKIGGESFRDKLTAVWFELMDFAGKCNNDGALSRHKEMPCENDEIPYTELEDIATMIDRDEEELKLCMSFYIKEGMVSIIDDVYSLSNWSKYQNEEGLNKIKEQNRLRKQRQREREKELLPAECHAEHRDMSRDTSRDVTLQNKNIERDIDKEKDNIYKYIVGYLNEKTGKAFKDVNQKTRSHINARLKEGYTVEDFKKVIDIKVAEWKGTQQDMYLRPETLFGTKFESYLNTKPTTIKPKTYQRADKTDLDGIL